MLRFATFLLISAACFGAEDAQSALLGWLEPIAREQLDRRAAAVSAIQSIPAAEERKQTVRAKILELIGGLPDYTGPLNAKVTGRIEQPGYVIEKLYFESLPKLYVAANLYRPSAAGKYPGVLLPLGHWDEGKSVLQRIAGNLALKGFVVLTFDPLGQGERLQAYDPRLEASLAGGSVEQHLIAGAQSVLLGQSFARYRIWEAKRALDYLLSRPEVDRDRIGCTGCSGGGTVTTYISALDPRIKVSAPACYINSFRELFSGPVGDSEQSIPGFLSSGLDLADYVELFAPKPLLIASTIQDFFPLEGARQVYAEAGRWYRIYGAGDKLRWVIGPGGHGTPLEIREAIYGWMIRWLKDGKGDAAEQSVAMHPEFELRATETGQVATALRSREITDVLRDELQSRKRPRTAGELKAALAGWSPALPAEPARWRVVSETQTATLRTESLALETEPGLELTAAILAPRSPGRKPGVLVVETAAVPSERARQIAQSGAVVLALSPRGKPAPQNGSSFSGDWLANTRAWLIGRNLPGLRAYDIRRGIDLLAARPDVDPARLKATATGVSGIWLLMAAALDTRLSGIWLDRTPSSLRSAFDNPLNRNLHDAALPGFALHWDLQDLAALAAPRNVLWSDPTDWMGTVVPLGPPYRYRVFEQSDQSYIDTLLR